MERAPAELEPVQQFIVACLAQVSEDGLRAIGQHGGYVTPEEFSITANAARPTEGNAAPWLFDEPVAYWHYLSSSNSCLDGGSCQFDTKQPPLRAAEEVIAGQSIEAQLSRYVEAHIGDCLDFSGFVGYNVAVEPAAVVALVIPGGVQLDMDMPTVVDGPTRSGNLRHFTFIHNLDLERIYAAASGVAKTERTYGFLERDLLNLISFYSGQDDSLLAPMSDSQITTGRAPQYRLRSTVATTLGQVMGSFTQMLQVAGSKGYRAITVPYDASAGGPDPNALYRQMVIPGDELGVDVSSLSFSFGYRNWPFYFDTGGQGELLSPDSMGINLVFFYFGVDRWQTAYDISWPVVVSISHSDWTTASSPHYTFNVAMEGNIRGNQPLTADEAGSAPRGGASELFSDPANFNSGLIEVIVRDGKTNDLLAGVSVHADTGGALVPLYTTGNVVLRERFPVFNGALRFVKFGYLPAAARFAVTRPEQGASVEVSMWPQHDDLKLVLEKTNISKDATRCTNVNARFGIGSPEPWNENDIAFVTLTRQPTGLEGPYEIVGQADANGVVTLQPGIVPGDYTVRVDIIRQEALYIPPREQCSGSWPFRQCQTIPAINLDALPAGVREYTVSEPLRITRDIYRYDALVLPIPYLDLYAVPEDERIAEDLQLLDSFSDYTGACSGSFRVRYGVMP